MNVTPDEIADLESKTASWLAVRANAETADRLCREELDSVRATYSKGGQLLVDEGALAAYEQRWRAAFDQTARDEGQQLDAARERVLATINAATEDAATLRSPVQRVPPGSDKVLLAGILDELQVARVHRELNGLTRAQLVDVMAGWTDEDHNPLVRTVEAAVLAGTLPRLGVRDDPDTDAIAIGKLQTLVRDRRAARVPTWLAEARTRVLKLNTLRFSTMLGHLRSGKGIASRPAPLMTQVPLS